MKKPYTKPTFEFIELRPEERLAGSNDNCHAERGRGDCAPAGHPGGGQ